MKKPKRVRARRLDHNPGAITRTEHGGSFIPLGERTSKRCRSTHDVPYSLRCVKSSNHEGKHKDKENNEWD